MSLISTWSTIANDNQMPVPDGWPEGQPPSSVNNCAREMMAAIRLQWNDAAWFNFGYNVTRVSGNSFSVTSATNNTVTLPAAFEVNGRIKLYDSTTIYGTITTVSASAASTLVTFTPDAFSLTSSFSSVANSIIPATNTPIPGLIIPEDVVTQTTQQIYAVDSGATNAAQITLSPVLSNYVSGELINFKALRANTGTMTLQVDALGAKTLKKAGGASDLASGDVVAGQIVSVIYDGTNFQVVGGIGGSGGSGESVSRTITKNSHGFSVGDLVYLNNSSYDLALADDVVTAEVVGIVSAIIDTNNVTLTTYGYVSGLSSLSAGNVYFLSDSVPGEMDLSAPTTEGFVEKPVFIASSTTSGYFVNFRGNVISTGSTTGGLLGVQIFKSSGTYTPTPGTSNVLIKAWGAGGGGGSTNSGSIGGAAGGGGAYVEAYFANSASRTITIGAGGTGGLANNASNGANGTATSFSSILVAAPGDGALSGGGGPGAGGTIAACTVPSGGMAIAGGRGGDAVVGIAIPGIGGQAFGSYGLSYPTDISSSGSYPNSGMGGGGGNNSNNSKAGGSGLMIIYEYS